MVHFVRQGAEYYVEVMAVTPESPASRGSIREGDLIVAIDGRDVARLTPTYRFLAEWSIGTQVGSPSFADRISTVVKVVPVQATSSG